MIIIMKTLASSLLAVTALLAFSSCKTAIVEPARPTVHTTTTEETTIHRPHTVTTTTETEVRRY